MAFNTPNILKGNRSFWIQVGPDGFIFVGKRGEEKPLMSFHDKDPFMVTSLPHIPSLLFYNGKYHASAISTEY